MAIPRSWNEWIRFEIVAGLAILYIFFWSICALLITSPNDLDVYFLPPAKIALSGHPLSVYSFRHEKEGGFYPNAHGPLSLVPLTLVAAVASNFNFLDDFNLRRMLILAVFSIFPILMAHEGFRAIERLRGKPLKGLPGIFAWVLFLFSPILWLGVLVYGHIEIALMMWLVLLAVRKAGENQLSFAGIFFGLAVVDRSTAVLYLVPMFLFIGSSWGIAKAVRLGIFTTLIVVAGTLPFLVYNSKDFVFSMVGYRDYLPTNTRSIWYLLPSFKFLGFVQKFDTLVAIVMSVAISFIVVLRRKIDVRSPDVFQMFVVSSLIFPLVIRTTAWPYYFFDAYVFSIIWWMGSNNSLIGKWGIVFPVVFTILGVVTRYSILMKHDFALYRLVMAVLVGCLMAALLIKILKLKSN